MISGAIYSGVPIIVYAFLGSQKKLGESGEESDSGSNISFAAPKSITLYFLKMKFLLKFILLNILFLLS